MPTSENKKFTVTIKTDELNTQSIQVTTQETTDGLPYYICKIDETEIQLRKDDKWEVIWGELSAGKIDAIGKEIEKHIVKQAD